MTAQICEVLSIDGAEHGMRSLPLVPYLEAQSPKIDLERISPDYCTALWRRYIGHWRIADGRLLLDRLGTISEQRDIDLGEVFPGRSRPIVADWFTGKLRLPGEPELVYVHMGWGSTFRYERIIHVHAGLVVRERHVDHTARFLAHYADLHRLLTEAPDGPEAMIGLNGLTWLTDEGRALIAEHLGIFFPEQTD